MLVTILVIFCRSCGAFGARTLLVRCQEEHPACRNWVMRCWCGSLSGARCKCFPYGPADTTATPSCLASLKSRMFLPFWCRLTQIVLGPPRPNSSLSSTDLWSLLNKNLATVDSWLTVTVFLGYMGRSVVKENLWRSTFPRAGCVWWWSMTAASVSRPFPTDPGLAGSLSFILPRVWNKNVARF